MLSKASLFSILDHLNAFMNLIKISVAKVVQMYYDEFKK